MKMNIDSYQSVYRERLLEHLLIGELLKYSWLHDGAMLEVSQPSIDRSGHDVVLEVRGIMRHVQLKASSAMATTASQKIHIGLASKPSGCVVWMRFDAQTMQLGPFLFFGAEAGEPLPCIDSFKTARHTKGNPDGIKAVRPNVRVVPMSKFQAIHSIPDLYRQLFGSPSPTTQ